MKTAERDAPPVLFAGGLAERAPGESVVLEPEEARHAKALRLAPGANLRLADGAGTMWLASWQGVDGGRAAVVELEHSLEAPGPLPVAVWLPVASRQASLRAIERVTEFGVRSVLPTSCARSASVADAAWSGGFRGRAYRKAVAAMKQSGGAYLPELGAPATLEDRLDRLLPGTCYVLLDPAGDPVDEVLQQATTPAGLGLLVGPEGGLTDRERARCLEAGFLPAGLGPTVLRFETAIVAAVAAASLWHWRNS